MDVHTLTWSSHTGWSAPLPARDQRPTLALVFADPSVVAHPRLPITEFLQRWAGRAVLGCSSAGHFLGDVLLDAEMVITIIRFDATELRTASVDIAAAGGPRSAARELGIKLARVNLRGVLLFGAGDEWNAGSIAAGIGEVLPGVPVVGGLAASDARDSAEWVIADNEPQHGQLTGVGFLGDALEFTCASASGWDSFGPQRRVTRSERDVLYELDGRRVLDVYCDYLGELSAELPAAAMLFPLAIPDLTCHTMVRTAVTVDAVSGGMRFHHDLAEDTPVRLMRTSYERLIDGAGQAARQVASGRETYALAVGGVGRRLVLGTRTEFELDAMQRALSTGAQLNGFYGHGEFVTINGHCQLQNQSMMLLTLAEVGVAA